MNDPAPLVLLHEDDDLVAVQKPSGEPVIPTRDGSAQDCVQRRLERQLGRRLFVVHRIDKDASGVVVFALHAEAHRALSLAFEHRQVSKTYAAFVAGAIEPPQGRLDIALHPARKGKTRPALPGEPGAQAATTEYATQKRWARLREPVIPRSFGPATRDPQSSPSSRLTRTPAVTTRSASTSAPPACRSSSTPSTAAASCRRRSPARPAPASPCTPAGSTCPPSAARAAW